MTTTENTTTYTVTLVRPSRSKCPNAWARRSGSDTWLPDTFTATHGEVIELGGNVRRATRIERVSSRIVIDGAGDWTTWAGAGTITITEDAQS